MKTDYDLILHWNDWMEHFVPGGPGYAEGLTPDEYCRLHEVLQMGADDEGKDQDWELAMRICEETPQARHLPWETLLKMRQLYKDYQARQN